MLFSSFHFEQTFWLWGLLIPILFFILPQKSQQKRINQHYKAYADAHLLPYLLAPIDTPPPKVKKPTYKLGTIVWCLGILALASPRWDYDEIELFQPSSDVVILFDLSQSMNALDVKPSRISRAQQEVADLLKNSRDLNMGLVAFATLARTITPITADLNTLQRLLPSLKPDLTHLQGSHLIPALNQAQQLFASRSAENSRNLIIVTDGDFAESKAELNQAIEQLQQQGVITHFLGIGTQKGATILQDNIPLTYQGKRVTSQLNRNQLIALAQAGDGIYQQADYLEQDTQTLLNAIHANAPPLRNEENPLKIWHERFYILVALMLLLLLPWFRSV